jgi:hypothetical protein
MSDPVSRVGEAIAENLSAAFAEMGGEQPKSRVEEVEDTVTRLFEWAMSNNDASIFRDALLLILIIVLALGNFR